MTDTFFAEIRTLVAACTVLEVPNPEQDLAAWYHAVRGDKKQTLTYPRVVLFAGSHAGFDLAPTQATVAALATDSHPVHRLCAAIDTDFSVHELALEEPVGALGLHDCAEAVAYGMMMVDEAIDVIGVAAFGAGTVESAARLRGQLGTADPLQLLQQQGGREIAAACGVMLAARMARVPVVLGGAGAVVAAELIAALRADLLSHCLIVADADETGALAVAEAVARLQNAVTAP
jgi:nicotinate-nucleotide--dimethylbenzimidazole phosphoribosyltransferase